LDGQGTERTVTNGSQTVVGTLNLDGFGNTVGSTGSSSNPYMYAANSGYRNDGDAGLTHVGARYYDAQVGRFITRDTYLDQKAYLYCEHDPVNNLDPSGHDLKEIIRQVFIGVAQGAGTVIGTIIGGALGPVGGRVGFVIGSGIGRGFGEGIWEVISTPMVEGEYHGDQSLGLGDVG
jgi:RHS repeat-associated protein